MTQHRPNGKPTPQSNWYRVSPEVTANRRLFGELVTLIVSFRGDVRLSAFDNRLLAYLGGVIRQTNGLIDLTDRQVTVIETIIRKLEQVPINDDYDDDYDDDDDDFDDLLTMWYNVGPPD